MRRVVRVVAFVLTLIVGAASVAAIVSQTAWFKEWLRGFVVRQAEQYLNGELTIGRLDGNLLFGVELENVAVTMDGTQVVAIKDVGLDYSVFTILRGGSVVLDDIRLNQPVFRIERTDDGWNIMRLMKARTPDSPRARRPIEVGEIGVSGGSIFLEGRPVATAGVEVPAQIERIDASVGVSSSEDALSVDVGHVSLRGAAPDIGINALSGVIRRTPDGIVLDNVSLRTEESSLQVDGTISMPEDGPRTLDIRASSDRLVTAEIARVVPALRGYDLRPAFEISARGPFDRLSVTVAAREEKVGRVSGDVVLDVTGEATRVSGPVSMEHLDIGPLLAANGRRPDAAMSTDVTGSARIDLTLPSRGEPLRGSYTLNAGYVRAAGYEARAVVAKGEIDGRTVDVTGSASAYGGQATATGRVTFGTPLALNLSGRAANVDLRNLPRTLPVPAVPSDLQFAYTLHGRGSVFSGEAHFDDSTLVDASIAQGTTAQFTVGGGAPQYAAQGSAANVDLARVGEAFQIPALARERYRSRIDATFTLAGSGGGAYPLTLETSGTLMNSTLFGAAFPQMAVSARLDQGDATVSAMGAFANLDPAVVAENERYRGNLAGSADVQAVLRDYRGGVTIDSVDASGRIELQPSTLGRITFDSATVEGMYARREGEIAELVLAGPDVNVEASGRVSLTETGDSNLSVHADASQLERIGEIIGRPIAGAAVVDATVTGNSRELRAAGTLKGSNLAYGGNNVLALQSTFDATVPELEPSRASVKAKSTATFLEVGGQSISEVAADTTYTAERLEFNATAREGAREVEAAGAAVIHADHQEVHLANLALRTEGIEWRTAPGSETAVRYGDNSIAVENLDLVSGDQRLTASGALGAEGQALTVRAENVDVAQIDRLAFGEERMAGRLTAEATLTGAIRDPQAEGTFTLAQGAFQQFTFDSLSGMVDRTGRGLNIDVRLDQSPMAWATAKGFAPFSLFRRTGVAGHQPAVAGDAVDIMIESSPIDLGIIQGFTSYVTNVTGVLQANVRVLGTGEDPHFEGAVDISGGAFSVPDLNTAYTGLDTRVDLSPDVVNIDNLRIVDEHGQIMTVGGSLAVHERMVGGVDLTIASENFEVIDNELADLKLDSDLKVTGELRAPRVVGAIEVETGNIDVARVLEMVTADPYSTEAVSLEGTAGVDAPQPLRPTLFDAVDFEIGLAVPSSLVLRGSDLRPVNAPIDFGDLNVTVGGALQIRKPPSEPIRLIGEVNTVRGNYTFQGRRFDILRDGRIRFDGADVIDPVVDIRTTRVISGVETFVRVQGTMRRPELSFSSSPPLDEADILSLIVFNVPINQLGEGQQISLAERAGALAGSYLTSGLTRSIANALELDEFEIQTQSERGLGPTVSIGEQVGERLFFRLRQGFGAAEATEFILEYQLADFLRLQGSVAETVGGAQRVMFRRVERGGLDLIFFFNY